MPIKKSDLYSKIWKACDELRGGMDASEYKDYILTVLFIKYVSDKAKADPTSLIEVPQGASFDDMVKLKNTKTIGDDINKRILAPLAKANDLGVLKEVADFNSDQKLGEGKAKVDRLSKIIGIFQDPALDFSSNSSEGDDILGDAYEYLMRHFATQSGKSKGQFYTPAEVSRVLAKVIGIEEATDRQMTLYDPTCGSGSLLIKAADEAPARITVYGQEKDNSTLTLAKMNMVLHDRPEAVLLKGDTIANPQHLDYGELKRFDFLVANPPFSVKSWSNGITPEKDDYRRFNEYGVPPKKNGDYAFLLHMLASLKSTGKGATILPHGVLFRGNSEADIRKNLLQRGLITGIIGLPANLFYGTGIPACIIVLDKENAKPKRDVFMIEASKGYVKDGNKNRLRARDIHKIVDVFRSQSEIEKYSRLVPYSELEENEFNLNIPRYIDTQEEEDLQDIDCHLNGGIPARDVDGLSDFWDAFSSLKQELLSADGDKYQLQVEHDNIQGVIADNAEFKDHEENALGLFEEWKEDVRELLESIGSDSKPKEIISEISEKLLATFRSIALLDEYAIYQHLMTYWAETLQDDMYLIVDKDWVAEIQWEKKKWHSPLLPKEVVIHRYFGEMQQELEEAEAQANQAAEAMEELEEEHAEEDTFSEARSDAGNITKGELTSRIKAIKGDSEYADELAALQKYYELYNKEKDAKSKARQLGKELDKELLEKFKHLSTSDVKELVVDDKWLADLRERIQDEVESVNHQLTSRVKELAERYADTLPELQSEVEELREKVEKHLEVMGYKW